MRVLTQVDKRRKVAYTVDIEEEHIPIRGNALASGDAAEDRKAERQIERQLQQGNLWAWCAVTVTASRGEHTGVDHLGACSYRNLRDFMRGGYWTDMKAQALKELKSSEAIVTV